MEQLTRNDIGRDNFENVEENKSQYKIKTTNKMMII